MNIELTPTTVAARFGKGSVFAPWRAKWRRLTPEAKRVLCELIAGGMDIEKAFDQIRAKRPEA